MTLYQDIKKNGIEKEGYKLLQKDNAAFMIETSKIPPGFTIPKHFHIFRESIIYVASPESKHILIGETKVILN